MGFINFSQLSVTILIIIFLISTWIIAFAGYRLAAYADQLADITGIGEAATGAIFLGAVTSISGIATTVTAAVQLDAALAVSNAIGGIVAQTTFLAIADLTYRKVNLEHAAASMSNIMYGVILMILLMELLFISVTPPMIIWGFHPGVLLIPVTYIAGLKMVSGAKKKPMWRPRKTQETVLDIPHEENKSKSLPSLVFKFISSAVIIAICGYVVAQTGIGLSEKTALSSSFIGALFTSVATSLPELVVTISAVRQGALTLAVGNILGGNSFDILMVPLADIFYQDGSILHISSSESFMIMILAGFITCVTILGLIDREKKGIGNIGWESVTVLISFIVGYTVLYFS